MDKRQMKPPLFPERTTLSMAGDSRIKNLENIYLKQPQHNQNIHHQRPGTTASAQSLLAAPPKIVNNSGVSANLNHFKKERHSQVTQNCGALNSSSIWDFPTSASNNGGSKPKFRPLMNGSTAAAGLFDQPSSFDGNGFSDLEEQNRVKVELDRMNELFEQDKRVKNKITQAKK